MTIEELIDELKQFPKDMEVRFWSGLEPSHKLGAITFDFKKNILFINDAECVSLDNYIYIEE